MQFEFSEEQQLIRDMAEEFARDQGKSEAVRRAMETDSGFDACTWQAICELGFPGLLIREDLGGQGLGAVEMALVFEALGSHLIPGPLLGTGVLAASLLAATEGDTSLTLQREIASSQRCMTVAEFKEGRADFVLDAHVADYLLAKIGDRLLAIRAEQPGHLSEHRSRTPHHNGSDTSAIASQDDP